MKIYLKNGKYIKVSQSDGIEIIDFLFKNNKPDCFFRIKTNGVSKILIRVSEISHIE